MWTPRRRLSPESGRRGHCDYVAYWLRLLMSHLRLSQQNQQYFAASQKKIITPKPTGTVVTNRFWKEEVVVVDLPLLALDGPFP